METPQSNISLLDLTSQFPFKMDETVKKEICFGETLIISCGHYEGDIGGESSDSEWSCEVSVKTESSHEMVPEPPIEIKDAVQEGPVETEDEEEDDFHIFFFPDCQKPQPQNSKASLIIENGLPKINPFAKNSKYCTCKVKKPGQYCDCYTKLPCECGAKTTIECTCAKKENICICRDGMPMPVCLCKGSDVCLCHPDGKIRAICTCDQVDKPCVCHPGKYPNPVCQCKHKPKLHNTDLKSIGDVLEEDTEEQISSTEEHPPPCDCQKKDCPSPCLCLKGEGCICKKDMCICGLQKTCSCKSLEPEACSGETKSICECPLPQVCTCGNGPLDCKCFCPSKQNCTCGDPENCKCLTDCECTRPCLCDTFQPEPEECLCLTKPNNGEKVCTCGHPKKNNLKKVRAGKHGYRWCHDVDPRHTYFDYGYGRHDKIQHKEEEEVEKVKILGLHDDKVDDNMCEVHGVKAPPYTKKVRKPSLDCCSAVGGISICVETLGEDKGKFLVQVVSNASKEGAKTGSKLVGILDCNLHTMEENRTEHITKKDVTKERRSYLAICNSGYYNKVMRICGDRHVIKRLYHTFEQSRNFLLEAANVVFLRYLALTRHKGNVKTDTLLMDGLICESVYVCMGVSQAIVNGKPLFVAKVERHIIEPSGFIHQALTTLTLRGYIVTHEWADNSYICHLNPLLRVVPERDEVEPHAPLREKWRDDMQLLSDYLDFKSCRTSEGGRYVTENGDLTGTLRDYLQAILLLRPADTLQFTRHYFGSALSAMDLPTNEYFDPSSRHVRYYFFEQ